MHPRTRKFLSYYRPYRGLLVADLGCAFVASVVTLLLPLLTSYITRTVLASATADAMRQVLFAGLGMVLLVVVFTLCNTFVDYQGHMMGALMERDMRDELFAHLQQQSFYFYDQRKTGQLIAHFTSDLFAISELYHHGPEDLFIAIVKAIGVFIILFAIDVQLSLGLLLFLPLMLVYALYFNRKMHSALRETKDRVGDINAQVEDTLAGIRVVQSFTNEPIERAKFGAANARFVASHRAGYRSEAYFHEGIVAFAQLMTVAVIVLGGARILDGALDIADLITIIFCVGILVDPIQRLVNVARVYQEGITGFERFMEVIEIAPSIADAPDAITIDRVAGRIVFDKVRFGYSTAAGDVLSDLSLTITAGEYVALVGPSGAGKTTLCALIPRFYEVCAGSITLDGVDIRQLTIASLRRQIGVVQQDVYLFSGTVLENIAYGDPGASRDAIIAAAEQAAAHEFIMALPNGYDTDIGQRGVRLSGGQKQRLSIARVFLKDPPVLIFDEATSSLDNTSEAAVQAALERLRRGRTTLVIAHRLSTIRNASRIVVLDAGTVAETGTHAALLAHGGVYAELYNQHSRM